MADAEKPEKSSGGGSKIVPILLVVNSVLVAAVLAAFLLKGGGEAQAKADPAAKAGEAGEQAGPEAPGPSQKLADFVVHLRDAEVDRYARVSFDVECATEEDKTRLNGFMPRVRDGFIAYLSDRTLEEMRGSEAIARTKHALEKRLAELAPGVKVKGLYVTDLVIQ
jgi:flagellar FliL protein